jgi:ribosome-associated heat shock protein Hsp15
MNDKVRIDKWLWAARFFKTRSLATDEINKGRLSVNDQVAKPSKELKIGDTLSIKREGFVQIVNVLGLSQTRGPASTAQLLYRETEASLQNKLKWQENRKYAKEPSLSIEKGRPTKRDRRELDQSRDRSWNDRWSASID